MKILDRYLLREWSRIFVVMLMGFPILVIVIDLVDRLDRYLSRGLTKGAVALSYVYGMPETMFLVLPVAVLIATVFTVVLLGRHSELTAAKASGLSFHRIVRPLFLAAGGACALGLVLGEVMPVAASKKREILKEKAVRATSSRHNFVYRAEEGWAYAIGALQIDDGEMQQVILERGGTGPDNPPTVVAAERARYDDSTARWTLSEGALRYLMGPGLELAFRFDSLRMPVVRERPADLLAEPKAPEEMRYAELGRYIDALRRSGTDAKKLMVERALKLAVPFTCVIIALFGAPLAMTSPRSGMAFGIALSLGTAIVFLLLVQVSKAVGAGGVLPPTLAAWFPNLLFTLMAVGLLRRVRT